MFEPKTPDATSLTQALDRVSRYRYLAGTEGELQDQIARVLTLEAIEFQREHILDAKSRVDFYLPQWRAGVEVKIDGSAAEVIRQLYRYSQFPSIDVLVLVTRRARHGDMPASIGDKTLITIPIWRGSL